MTAFIDKDFLLETEYAKELYHEYAGALPILDYHCHLPPLELAEDRRYDNITQLWIDGDHYKWRAMRQLGLSEELITGGASDLEKFEAWAKTVPYTLRNPLYHWTHLELLRYFDVEDLLNEENAREIYDRLNDLIKTPDYSARGLVRKMNVELICTTDDPLDDLSAHQTIREQASDINMLPTFRPDGILAIEKEEFEEYIEALSQAAQVQVKSWETLLAATQARIDYFHCQGCCLSDHGLPFAYSFPFEEKQVDTLFKRRLTGQSLTDEEVMIYKSAIMHNLAVMYAEKGWVMQLHLGPLRDTNTSMLHSVGIDAGVDSIGDYQHAEHLAGFLNKLDEVGQLPKTILYNSNPADNEVFATMAGNFSDEGIKGKVQFGAAWWFLDQKEGITKQIEALSNMGLLSCSIGMVTDSRSFLSFPRHEYYRRILCNIFGNDIKAGYMPHDPKWIGKMIQDICYGNANSYFAFAQQTNTSSKKADAFSLTQ